MARHRPSRCLSTANAPQVMRWATIDGETEAPKKDLLRALVPLVPQAELADYWAWVMSTFRRVEHCLAVDPRDVKPVARHPHIWEIRIDDQPHGVHIRAYQAEVPELPGTLVILHAHVKLIAETDEETKALQDAAIFTAIRRFDLGRATRWGIV